MLFRQSLWLILLVTSSHFSLAHAKEPIVLATGEWAPYQSKQLKNGGFITQVIVESLQEQGYQVKLKYMPTWKRAMKESIDGNTDGTFIWLKNDDRDKYFLYSTPVISLTNSLFYRNSNPIQWNSVQDLTKYRIGGVQAYSYGIDDWEKNGTLNVIRIFKPERNYQKLMRNRIDLIIEDTDVGMEILHRINLADKISPHPKPITYKEYYLLISKKSPRAQEIVEAFNRGFDKIKSSGQFNKYRDASYRGEYLTK